MGPSPPPVYYTDTLLRSQILCSVNSIYSDSSQLSTSNPDHGANMNASGFSNQFPPLHSRLFKTKEEAFAYARNRARQHRYGLTIRRSGEQGRKIRLCCDRGSHQNRWKPTFVHPELRKRRRTRQTDCSYQVNIRYLKRESMWKVSERLARSALDSDATRFHNQPF